MEPSIRYPLCGRTAIEITHSKHSLTTVGMSSKTKQKRIARTDLVKEIFNLRLPNVTGQVTNIDGTRKSTTHCLLRLLQQRREVTADTNSRIQINKEPKFISNDKESPLRQLPIQHHCISI